MKNRLNLASLSVQDQAEYFSDKLEPEPNTGCWIWTGSLDEYGYGMVSIGYRPQRTVRIHRLFYAAKYGPIPSGYDVTRTCGLNACGNPQHLRLAIGAVYGVALENAGRTKCPQGHPHDVTFVRRDGKTARGCRTCRRENNRRFRKIHPEYPVLRAMMFDALGGAVCVRCGFLDRRALQIDHKKGGGTRHQATFPGVRGYARYVSTHPEEFQVLCANCNWIKRVEQGENGT